MRPRGKAPVAFGFNDVKLFGILSPCYLEYMSCAPKTGVSCARGWVHRLTHRTAQLVLAFSLSSTFRKIPLTWYEAMILITLFC